MKILITGSKGFIGRNLANTLSEHDIFCLTRQEVDLTDRKAVDEFFKNKNFDLVIHCAMSGGRRYLNDNSDILWKNLAMFYNLANNQNKFNKMIIFGSGAELDRDKNIDLSNFYFRENYPLDYYGMAKNIICRLIENEEKFNNIRLFNVFGADEEMARFVRSNIQRYIDKEPIIIHQNKLMDFFYIDDLISLVKFYIDKNIISKEINAVYKTKYTLLEIANIINNLSNYKVEIILEKENLSNSYIGKSNEIDLLPIKFKGLEQGIKEIYNKLK